MDKKDLGIVAEGLGIVSLVLGVVGDISEYDDVVLITSIKGLGIVTIY